MTELPIVAITGAGGFIGRNLSVRARERGWDVRTIGRDTPAEQAQRDLGIADIIFHLAGVNRPADPAEFLRVGRDYTSWVADAVVQGGRQPLLVLSSSAKADEDSDYGLGKRAAEHVLMGLSERQAATVLIYRLCNVFGKWARPDYNSAVATFCHNLARGLPIRIDDPSATLSLLYIDTLIDAWLSLVENPPFESGYRTVGPVRTTTVGAVAHMIGTFAAERETGRVEAVGEGLLRELYATFIAALPTEEFGYKLGMHEDSRGRFVEMLKTPASGQISYFTAHPGVTRGGHYHHSKVEKFLIVHGEALFRFRHVVSGETHEIRVSADRPSVIETIPGWTHDVTNVGEGILVSLLWANEAFDPSRPDTVAMPV
jgi:UDP-2-acetamido-2,6-beta-L-arabino-hexul-4-ose reductase